MTFDWTVTLGNILTTLTMLVGLMVGLWGVLTNHITHVEERLRRLLVAYEERSDHALSEIKEDLREVRRSLMKKD